MLLVKILTPTRPSSSFSKNVKREARDKIINQCNFQETKEPGCYLGAFLTQGRTKKGNLKNIVDKAESKLCGWKSQCLPMAGRITLVQSAIGPIVAVQSFFLSTTRLLTILLKYKCEDKVEKKERLFKRGQAEADGKHVEATTT